MKKPRTEEEAHLEVLRRMDWPAEWGEAAKRTYAYHGELLALRWEEFLAVLPMRAWLEGLLGWKKKKGSR